MLDTHWSVIYNKILEGFNKSEDANDPQAQIEFLNGHIQRIYGISYYEKTKAMHLIGELARKLKEVHHITLFNLDELKKCKRMLETLVKERIQSQKLA